MTGLLTGQDIVKALQGRALGDEILVAGNMLKAGEDIFLDDMTLEELSQALHTPARRVPNTGDALLMAILGQEAPAQDVQNPYEGAGSVTLHP